MSVLVPHFDPCRLTVKPNLICVKIMQSQLKYLYFACIAGKQLAETENQSVAGNNHYRKSLQ